MSEGTTASATRPPGGAPDARPLISIIVPVYNEDENIDRTFRALQDFARSLEDQYRFEFLFNDNHSTDHSFEKLTEIARADRRVRVVRFARNFGFQKSVLTGYRLARGDAAIQIDADLQDPPAMMATFLDKWREGHDVVVGVRRLRREPGWLRFGRRTYYRLMEALEGPHLIRDGGDFRLVDRSVLNRLRRINDPHLYLRGLISSLARRQVGIAYDRSERTHNKSKFRLVALMRFALDGIMAHSSLPLQIAFYVGMIIALGTVVLAVIYFLLRLFWPELSPQGFATTQILILFGIGLNSIFLGILGVYVGRIYDQVRERPPTVISDLVNFDDDVETVERDLVP